MSELTTTTMPLTALTEWSGNARRGDVDSIKQSMRQNGVFQPLIVQSGTRRVIAGNHRLRALRELHAEAPDQWGDSVTVVELDVDDDRAMRIHLADNKTSDDAEWEHSDLLAQLEELEVTDTGLVGSGFSDDDLNELRLALGDGTAEPELEPEDEPEPPAMKLCQKCGYDVQGNPDGLDPWMT